LFDKSAPSAQRALAVLQGRSAGVVWVDDPADPRRAVVREQSFGITFFGGYPSTDELLSALAWVREAAATPELREQSPEGVAGHTHLEFWIDDPRIDAMPQPTLLGGEVVFDGGRDPIEHAPLPPGTALVDAEEERFRQAEWRQDQIDIFGSEQAFFEHGLGRYLVRGDTVLCEAYGEARAGKRWEVGVVTSEAERGRGYAYLTGSDLLATIESRGYEAVWHAAASNEASVALGRKLGFRSERRGPMFCYET
jgi:RimJ/RimL family protein N-acetyltransferase